MVWNPFTVADISIRSSAYMIQPTKTPFTVQPVLIFRNLIIKSLINILKIAGESELSYPWLRVVPLNKLCFLVLSLFRNLMYNVVCYSSWNWFLNKNVLIQFNSTTQSYTATYLLSSANNFRLTLDCCEELHISFM